MNTTGPERSWRVGELAAETGLTVRALHHYDEIGLLVPSVRGRGGHRHYTEPDVRRLHRILALRGFGLPLAEIADVLDDSANDPRELIRRQLAELDERIAVAYRLRHSLLGVLTALDQSIEPSSRKLIELIEVMTTMEPSLTQEQFDQLVETRRAAHEQLTPEQIEEMQESRRQLFAQLTPEQLTEMQCRRAALWPGKAEPSESSRP